MRTSPLILIVEDDEDTYELYSEFVASNGYSVVGASNGIEAVESALRYQPDLILMDIALPGRSGFDVARMLKNDPRSQHIAILALTGLVQNCFVDLAREVGCDAFLTKPCPLSKMLNEIERLLQLRAPARESARTVLLVEDDELIREALGNVFAEEAITVEEARNGQEALERLRSRAQPPGLIVLDLMMPVMDGWQFHEQQQRDPRLAHIPLLVLTAVPLAQTRMFPPGTVVQKPIDVPLLLDAIEQKLAQPRMHVVNG